MTLINDKTNRTTMLKSLLFISLLLASCQQHEQAIAADTTRASGLIYYPSEGPQYEAQAGQPIETQNNYPSRIRIALTRNISNLDPNTLREPEVSYFGAVGVGTPTVILNMVFDTGSGEIWLPHYNWFPLANNLHYDRGYSAKDSPSCYNYKKDFTFDYRQTSLSGDMYEDIVTLYEDMVKEDAMLMVGPSASFRQNFVAISNAGDEQFRWKPYDGVVGLAPVAQSSAGVRNMLLSFQQEHLRRANQDGIELPSDPINTGPYAPVPGAVMPGQQPNLVFAFWFNPNQNSRHGGELMLGGVDENRFVGRVYFHPLVDWFGWSLRLNYVQLGAQVVSCPTGCTVVLDTGANSIVGPRADVQEIYNSLQARYEAGMWLVDCNQLDQYPVISFKIDETLYQMSARHYTRMFRYRDTVVCYLAIKPWDNRGWLFGTSFIGAYYTVFDFPNRRVGFATPRS